MSQRNESGIRIGVLGAMAVIASALMITMLIADTGHLDSAGAASKPTTGKLEICSLAAANSPSLLGQSFSFTETADGKTVGPFTVIASSKPATKCGGLTSYQIGTKVHVAEAPTPGVEISEITVKNGKTVRTEGGGGSCSGATGPPITPITVRIGGSGTATVTYTNAIVVPSLCSAIEMCVLGATSIPSGAFTFTLTSLVSRWSKTVSLPSGSECTGDISIPAGQVAVTEKSVFAYLVSSVAAIPSSALVSDNLAEHTATFSVSAGNATTAIFTDEFVYA